MGNVFMIADLHLGHDLVANHRKFASAELHDNSLERMWTRYVRDTDTVWILGDLVMGDKKEYNLDRISSWPGTKHIILGNHDRAHPINRNGHNYIRPLMNRFESISMSTTLRWNGVEVILSHFPYDGDHTSTDRDQQWRLRDYGKPLIHGHTHSKTIYSTSDRGTPQVCVSVEAWMPRIPSLSECTSIVQENIPQIW